MVAILMPAYPGCPGILDCKKNRNFLIRCLVYKQFTVLTLIMILCRNLLKNTQFRQSKADKNHRFMLDSKSCRYFWKWEGRFCCKRWLFFPVTALKSPASELLPRITKLISEKWQKSWNNCTSNKLQSINPIIGVYQRVKSLSRRDAVIIHRLRIGHTRMS